MDAKTNFELSSYDPEEVEELQSTHTFFCLNDMISCVQACLGSCTLHEQATKRVRLCMQT